VWYLPDVERDIPAGLAANDSLRDYFAGSTCIITGGCGFIGSHLAHELVALGVKRLIIIDSLEYGSADNLPDVPAVELVRHHICSISEGMLRETFCHGAYLFHLAALKPHQTHHDPLQVIDVNVQGTQAVLAAAAATGVAKVVFASSLNVYGRLTGPPMVETEMPHPLTVYAMSKVAGENLCRHYKRRYGLPSVCLRYFFVYGPCQSPCSGYESFIVRNFERILMGRGALVPGDGAEMFDYLYVADTVYATLVAMQRELYTPIINVGSGMGISIAELTEHLQEVANTSLPAEHGHKNSSPGTRLIADITLAQEQLGLTSTTGFDVGLRQTFDWVCSRQGRK
jgi:UDP-glucose 4-epimerase